jgi:hypothetical protein
MQTRYSIEARSYNIMKIVSHNFWVLRCGDDVVSQLHGLATDRKTNRFKPIGIFSDRLGFYEFKAKNNDPNFIGKTQKFITIYQGAEEEILMRWNKAASQVDSLNKRDINYSSLGVFGLPITNSNSAFHLFATLMEFECCRFSGVFEPGICHSLDQPSQLKRKI